MPCFRLAVRPANLELNKTACLPATWRRLSLFTLLFAFLFAALTPMGSEGAEREDVIVVLDASGSMWGQIDGEPKIAIARRVIGDLLDQLPTERRIGLMAYGHNRKGDCADIELLAAVGSDRDAIRQAVESLNPKGKTPLSASVLQAAEALRYTENAATVILVSDGIETCDLDPCEVGTSLEESGVQFTAHVIGFDVTDVDALAQLECLSSNTGGRFLTAANADELSDALQQTVVEEVTATSSFFLRATVLEDGPVIEDGLDWTVQQAGGGDVLFEATGVGPVEAEVPAGVYDVSATREGGQTAAAKTVEVRPGQVRKTVTVVFDAEFEATVRVTPESSGAGTDVVVYWTGPENKGDYVALAEPEMEDRRYLRYQYVTQGNPLKFRLPDEPGKYEVRYVLAAPPTVLARADVEAVAVGATVVTVASAPAGSHIDVEWTGNDNKGDYISLAEIGSKGKQYKTYSYTKNGSPAEIRLPAEPGKWEVRYITGQSGEILASTVVEGTSVSATVQSPSSAPAGATIEVQWTGPNYQSDYIAAADPGSKGSSYKTYSYTRDGSPVELKLPMTPGPHEILYVLSQSKEVLARATIELTPLTATVEGPASGKVGTKVSVRWSGPAYQSDFIAIAEMGSPDNKYKTYSYPREGNPLSIKLPDTPGEYEIRYVTGRDKGVLARQPIRVE